MISPHLPPEQAANALLPVMLGKALTARGVTPLYVSHPAAQNDSHERPFDVTPGVTYVPRRGRDRFSRSPLGAVVAAARMALGMRSAVRNSDLVHLHGNGFIVEVGERLARCFGKPCVITLYGTDVWHHHPVRHRRFAGVVRRAAQRVFYSRGLLEFARPLGMAAEPSHVIYAPVNSIFHPLDEQTRHATRRDLGIGDEPLLLTVKRLHPVAGHDTLLRALPIILRTYPTAKLWLIGEGELRSTLETQTRALGVEAHVRFLGLLDHDLVARYCAVADLFVLPSDLESWGTVMLEALGAGTPVVTTDTAGGVEVRGYFPEDVTLAERGNAEALATAVCGVLAQRRRVTAAAEQRLRAEFDVAHTAERYFAVYNQALGSTR